MSKHHNIDYVELAASDLASTESFFKTLFSWTFTHYGPDYMDCADGGLMIGFYREELTSKQDKGGALVTFYSDDLEASLALVKEAGGSICKDPFSFPGGRRFQFTEPSGNEFAIWSKE